MKVEHFNERTTNLGTGWSSCLGHGVKFLPWARCEVLADCLNDELLRTSSGGRGVEFRLASLDLLRLHCHSATNDWKHVIGLFYNVTIFETIVAKTNYKVFLTDKRQRRREVHWLTFVLLHVFVDCDHHSTARECVLRFGSDEKTDEMMLMARVRGDAAASPCALCLALK